MRITELKLMYPKLYDAAYIEYIRQTGGDDYMCDSHFDSGCLNTRLYWEGTIEGREFWSSVYSGDLQKAKLLIPSYF